MKVFISQPMRGRRDSEIIRERLYLKSLLEIAYPDDEINIMNTFYEGHIIQNPLSLLGSAIQAMAHADLVVFANGWRDARGCRIEHDCAMEYDKNIVLQYVLEKLA